MLEEEEEEEGGARGAGGVDILRGRFAGGGGVVNSLR